MKMLKKTIVYIPTKQDKSDLQPMKQVQDPLQEPNSSSCEPRTTNKGSKAFVNVMDTKDEKKCRACLRDGQIPIYGKDNLSKDVSNIGGIPIRPDDPYPKYLCLACHGLLRTGILFRKKAQQSDKILRKCTKYTFTNSETTNYTNKRKFAQQFDKILRKFDFTNSKTTKCTNIKYLDEDLCVRDDDKDKTKSHLKKDNPGNKLLEKETATGSELLKALLTKNDTNENKTYDENNFKNLETTKCTNIEYLDEALCVWDDDKDKTKSDLKEDNAGHKLHEKDTATGSELLKALLTETTKCTNIKYLDEALCVSDDDKDKTKSNLKEDNTGNKLHEKEAATKSEHLKALLTKKDTNENETGDTDYSDENSSSTEDDDINNHKKDSNDMDWEPEQDISSSSSSASDLHCEPCNLDFETDKEFRTHKLTKEHRTKKVTCTICNKSYNHLFIEKHYLCHKNKPSHVCDICGKSFMHKGVFSAHYITHSYDNLNFKCSLCPYRSRFNSQLNLHMKTHTGEKKYGCSHCPSKFLRKNGLRIHLQIHEGVRNFKCPQCQRGFFTQGDLNGHYRYEHVSGDHTCNTCGKKYKSRKCLHQHELRSHKREKKVKGQSLYLLAEKIKDTE